MALIPLNKFKTHTAVLPTAVNASYNALQSAKASITTQTINWINTNYPGFSYNSATCARDVGYMIDSISFDLLHGGNKQTIKSAVYYYGYDETQTEIPGEIPQTTAAYEFIKTILTSVVKAELISVPYQVVVPQVINMSPGTDAEVAVLNGKIDVITNIINNGPSVVAAKTPIDLVTTTSVNAINAYGILTANRAFIQAEVIAYIDQTQGEFVYSQEKCSRDTGLIVDSIALDMIQNSISESVFAGLQYWQQSGYVDAIGGQITTTTAAISYVKSLAVSAVDGAGGSDNAAVVSNNFDLLLDILATGTAGVTDRIISNGYAIMPTNAGSTIYTAPIGVTSIVLMAQVSNVTTQTQYVTFVHSRNRRIPPDARGNNEQPAGVKTELVKNYAIPPDDAASLVTGKLILETVDSVICYASSADSCKITMSILETANA